MDNTPKSESSSNNEGEIVKLIRNRINISELGFASMMKISLEDLKLIEAGEKDIRSVFGNE